MKPFPDALVGNTKKALQRTFFAVEATSFEQQMLWERHAHGSLTRHARYELVIWEQVSPGWTQDVGRLGTCVCLVALMWAEIDGRFILFWHPCSAVSDSRKNEAWLERDFKKKWDQGTRRSVCDAQNFHHCLDAIREANRTALD